jgi:hypothetical protein
MNLVAVAVLGLSIGMMSVLRGNRSNDNITVAVNLAHDNLERLRSSRVLKEENRCPPDPHAGITAPGVSGGRFHLCWKIERSPLGRHLKHIEVTITWREQRDRELTLSTLVFREIEG